MTPKVAFIKTNPNKEDVHNSVKKAMELAGWKKCILGKKIFLKINTMSIRKVPGTNTSPWVLEGVLKELTKKRDLNIYVGDGNVCSVNNVEPTSKAWGYQRLCENYGVSFINLTKQKAELVNVSNIGEIEIPKILLECDSIISIPVLKTHVWSKITASMKNMFGCYPPRRHILHLKLDRAIVEINRLLKPSFTVIDGTICIEGSGPRTGIPKICNVIFASNNLVAADAACAYYMGFYPEEIPHLKLASDEGIGSIKYNIVGDKIYQNRFMQPKDTLVSYSHKRLRFSKFERLFFRTKIFDVLRVGANLYNHHYWYRRKGRKYLADIIRNSGYSEEFKYSK